MTVVGSVPEPALTQLVERRLLAMPSHIQAHPSGVAMSMLDAALPCRLRGDRG